MLFNDFRFLLTSYSELCLKIFINSRKTNCLSSGFFCVSFARSQQLLEFQLPPYYTASYYTPPEFILSPSVYRHFPITLASHRDGSASPRASTASNIVDMFVCVHLCTFVYVFTFVIAFVLS